MFNEELILNNIQKMEKVALEVNSDGFLLQFSGGKDSIVLYDLVRKSNVKFRAEMTLTTVDPPELLKFIHTNYPDVTFRKTGTSMFKLIIQHKILPTRKVRFCCGTLKETAGVGYVNLLGIRKAESVKRSKRNEIEISNYKYSNTFDQFEINQEHVIGCIKGKDTLLFSPIINMTDKEVWNYIHTNKLKVPNLYRMGYNRIGCVFCPMSSIKNKNRDRKYFPKFEYAYKKAIKYVMKNNPEHSWNSFIDENEVFDWWLSELKIKIYKERNQNKLKY